MAEAIPSFDTRDIIEFLELLEHLVYQSAPGAEDVRWDGWEVERLSDNPHGFRFAPERLEELRQARVRVPMCKLTMKESSPLLYIDAAVPLADGDPAPALLWNITKEPGKERFSLNATTWAFDVEGKPSPAGDGLLPYMRPIPAPSVSKKFEVPPVKPAELQLFRDAWPLRLVGDADAPMPEWVLQDRYREITGKNGIVVPGGTSSVMVLYTDVQVVANSGAAGIPTDASSPRRLVSLPRYQARH